MNPIPERNPGGIAPLAHRGEPRMVSEGYYQDTDSFSHRVLAPLGVSPPTCEADIEARPVVRRPSGSCGLPIRR